jgi:predicted transcriptional regulator
MNLTMTKEQREDEFYHPDNDEWAAIQEGLAQAERGEFVSAEEIAALLKSRAS